MLKKTKLRISAMLRVLTHKNYWVIIDNGENCLYGGVINEHVEDAILQFAAKIVDKRNAPTADNIDEYLAKLKRELKKEQGTLFNEKLWKKGEQQFRDQFNATKNPVK